MPEVRRLGVTKLRYRVEHLGSLPPVVNESSGLARRTTDGSSVWTLNDGGGRPTLYGIAIKRGRKGGPPTGTLLDSLPLPHLRNTDWEDIAQADTARLFIADLGNNANNRKDLTLYPVTGVSAGRSAEKPTTGQLPIRYADQYAFPPKARNFDCEAVFFRSDSLFLLSKNRKGHIVRLYGLPVGTGSAPVQSLAPLDSVYIKAQVTGAALSPDGQVLAVLTYGKVLFFRLKTNAATRLGQPTGCLRLPRGQAEAITYLTNTELLISNERGHLYRLIPR